VLPAVFLQKFWCNEINKSAGNYEEENPLTAKFTKF
jgi:hypothetical protein